MSTRNEYMKKKKRLPNWLKAVLIKAWFAGAVFYFVGWGLFINTVDQLDLMLVLGLVLGVLTDLIVNRIFNSMERRKGEFKTLIMFPDKKFLNFILNIIYGIVLCTLVAYTYQLINVIAIELYHLPKTTVALGTEPILFGILCVSYDMMLLQIKKLIIKRKGQSENENK